jgi:D-beta-D-heptose 7-phosphate kinase/D-beta-D-heptose 1-phosphate adenosyltransferase
VDAVILSDYGYDLLDGPLLSAVIAGAGGRVVTADSRYRIAGFGGVTLATPNVHEVEEALHRPIRTDADLEAAGRELHSSLGSGALLLTRGNKGMSLFRTGLPRLDIPAIGSEEVTDVSGAGDTVTAVSSLALAAGADLEEAAWLSNLAAGVVVMKIGAATCSPAELAETLERHL